MSTTFSEELANAYKAGWNDAVKRCLFDINDFSTQAKTVDDLKQMLWDRLVDARRTGGGLGNAH